jgi:hypothetical protein
MKKNLGLLVGHSIHWLWVIAIGIVLGLFLQFARAWTEPTIPPPGGNVGAPLNTSALGQSKIGGLLLNSGGAPNGLIVQNGNVGIGTLIPGAKLDVNGNMYTSKLSSTGNNAANAADPAAADVVIGSTAGARHDSSMMYWTKMSAIRQLADGNAFKFMIWNTLTPSAQLDLSGGNSYFNAGGGNVGIGNVNPAKKLDVAGEIHATGDICTDQGGGKCLSNMPSGSGGSIPIYQGPAGCNNALFTTTSCRTLYCAGIQFGEGGGIVSYEKYYSCDGTCSTYTSPINCQTTFIGNL